MLSKEPPLCRTATLAIFMPSGKMPVANALLHICCRGKHKRSATAIIGIALMSSSPAAVFVDKDLRIEYISCSLLGAKKIVSTATDEIYLSKLSFGPCGCNDAPAFKKWKLNLSASKASLYSIPFRVNVSGILLLCFPIRLLTAPQRFFGSLK